MYNIGPAGNLAFENAAVLVADVAFLPHTKAITIGTTAGILVYEDLDGETRTTDVLPLGTYPVVAKRILTGTTAVGLTGWY